VRERNGIRHTVRSGSGIEASFQDELGFAFVAQVKE
jgi:hypothetical protein